MCDKRITRAIVGLFLWAVAICAVVLIIISFCGCASVHQHLTKTFVNTNGVTEEWTLESRARSIFATTTLEKMKVTQGKTQAVGLTALNEDANGTNIVRIFELMRDIAVALSK